MNIIENLEWRYATKKMDASKKVSEQDINTIKEAIRLSASSYGLQPYKVLDIRDEEIRASLKPHCWNQSQITDASHLFIFCNRTEVSPADVDSFVQLKANINGFPPEQGKAYSQFVSAKLAEKSSEEQFHWSAKQAYIALGNALTACAELRIDSTPIEGFEAEPVNSFLKLSEQGLNACVLLAIGYRSKEDATQHAKKVRKSSDDLFKEIHA